MFFREEITAKQKNILYFLLLFLVFLWHLPVLTVFSPGEDNLDPSWMKTLHYAAENHLSFGKEFIFTYGPLGYLFRPMDKTSYFLAVLLHTVFLFSLKDLFLFRNKKEFYWKLFFAFFTIISTLSDLFLLFFPFIILNRAGKKPDKNNVVFLLFITGNAAICVFMKFTYFPLVFLSLISADILLYIKHKRLFLLGAFLLFLPLIWLLAGQKITEYIHFFLYSFEIMDGFNKAMACFIADIKYVFITGFSVLYLLCVLLYYLYRKKDTIPLLEKILIFFASCLPLYISYKYAVVRMDAGHIAGAFLNLAVLAAYFLCSHIPEKIKKKEILLRTGLWMIALGLPVLIMARMLPGTHTEYLKKAFFYNLFPSWNKKTVCREEKEKSFQGKSCDLFAYGEFDTLQKMGFTYKPRPVMQSYSAYTEKLLRSNQSHIAKAPTDFLLFDLENLDNRFPMLADYSILPLCGKYVPEKSFNGNRNRLLLMKKYPDGREKKLQKMEEKTFLPGETIQVVYPPENKLLYVSFSMEYSFLGKLAGLLWRTPPPVLHFSLNENRFCRKDLIPSMAETPFLFSPYVENTEEFAALWDKEKYRKLLEKKKILSFRIDFTARLYANQPCPHDEKIGRLLYKKKIKMTLYTAPVP